VVDLCFCLLKMRGEQRLVKSVYWYVIAKLCGIAKPAGNVCACVVCVCREMIVAGLFVKEKGLSKGDDVVSGCVLRLHCAM
jgi:hypothetical protein